MSFSRMILRARSNMQATPNQPIESVGDRPGAL